MLGKTYQYVCVGEGGKNRQFPAASLTHYWPRLCDSLSGAANFMWYSLFLSIQPVPSHPLEGEIDHQSQTAITTEQCTENRKKGEKIQQEKGETIAFRTREACSTSGWFAGVYRSATKEPPYPHPRAISIPFSKRLLCLIIFCFAEQNILY